MSCPAESAAQRIQVVPMPQLAEAINREDNWTGTTDGAVRRKAQNRSNTRAYRKRKALAKRVVALGLATETQAQSEPLVECWSVERQAVSRIPESRLTQLYNARDPLLSSGSRVKHTNIVFPLSPDHLITLLQFNAQRAMVANWRLVFSDIVVPIDCEALEYRVSPFPVNPELLPSSLLPTMTQQTVPRGGWIDIFPCPKVRDRLIGAAGTFDEDELCNDCIGGLYEGFPEDEIERRGVIAWSPPWDITGWEMSEGFLRKWGWLLGEGLPEALEATNRWRLRRGEEPLVHRGSKFC
ncbi:hypothetical protein F5Y15DRAFT_420231 [Xylariaceae sp. FL0016]|nr:hypothetical protein F5Y15DRAFT_420231 [Xylariaceae sp. FL0016]